MNLALPFILAGAAIMFLLSGGKKRASANSYIIVRDTPQGPTQYLTLEGIDYVKSVLNNKGTTILSEINNQMGFSRSFTLHDRAYTEPSALTAAQYCLAQGGHVVIHKNVIDGIEPMAMMAFSDPALRRTNCYPGSEYVVLSDGGASIVPGGGPGKTTTVRPPTVMVDRDDPYAGLFDANMTAEEKDLGWKMLSDPNIDPAVLEATADVADKQQHPRFAAALRKRAAELRLKKTAKTPPVIPPTAPPETTPPSILSPPPQGYPPTTPPTTPPAPPQQTGDKPFTIKEGHIPTVVAQYYTGDQARWKELVSNNPGSLSFGGPYGVTGWTAGKTILLPAKWNPWSKPEPAPLPTPKPAKKEAEGLGEVITSTDDTKATKIFG